MSGSYVQRVDRLRPGCLIFLVDQSHSMSEPLAGAGQSKASAVAEQLNVLIYELIQRCTKSHHEAPRPYFGVAVVGYGTTMEGVSEVGSRLGGALAGRDFVWTTDLALNPLRLEERVRVNPDGGRFNYRFPVWIDPHAIGGTPMCEAAGVAGRLVRSWVDRYPDSFPPIVINLTDGEATDGDPLTWSERIRSLRTSDGNVLMFNIGLAMTAETPMLFPDDVSQISSSFGKLLYEMSSPLPGPMFEVAMRQGFEPRPGARGFGMNADVRSVISFLNVGTSVGHLLR
jgi:hypothetical protein